MSSLILSILGFTAVFTAGLAAFEQIAVALLAPPASWMPQAHAAQARRPRG